MMLCVTFILLPLCYFFGESYDEFEEIPFTDRLSKSIKYTLCFQIFVAACIFVSLCFKNRNLDLSSS